MDCVHFVHIDPNGGRHTRFVGEGAIVGRTQRRVLVEVTASESNDIGPGDRIWIPKRDVAPSN